MPEQWLMIRVKASTHARLSALRNRLETAYQTGHRKSLPLSERDQFTLDALIAELVTAKEAHLKRAKQHRRPARVIYQG